MTRGEAVKLIVTGHAERSPEGRWRQRMGESLIDLPEEDAEFLEVTARSLKSGGMELPDCVEGV